jgi:hypothetical protein
MFDGIKIRCLGTNPKDWEGNSLLQFSSSVDVETGEILSNGKTAYYKGLYFQLIPSTVSNNTHCIVKGSLAKYYNNGRNNAFDYSMKMLIETIEELYKTFKINPFTAKIQSFEYGVNICTTQSVKQIVNGIRAFQNDTFVGLKDEGVFCGKQLKRQEYLYKVYDKGLVADIHDINMLRIEFAVKSIKTARKFKVETLSDLVKKESLELLKINLLNIWNNIIFYDSGMRWRKMDKEQKEKMLYYLDATNWIKFSKMQRLRAKAHFKSLFNLFCSSKTQIEIESLLVKKIDELDSDLSYHLRNFLRLENSSKPILELLPFTYLDKSVKSNINEPKKEVKNKPKKDEVNSSICRVTGMSLKGQKSGSHFLSHTGLKLLFENDRLKFDFVLQKHLPKQYKNSDLETKIIQTAKSIRTKDCVANIKANRIYPQHQTQLFG